MSSATGMIQPRMASRVPAVVLSVLLVLVVVSFVVYTQVYTAAEAWLASLWGSWFVPGSSQVVPGSSIVVFGVGTPHAAGLRVSAGCSAFILALPLFVAGAVGAYFGRFSSWRIVFGLFSALFLLVVFNQLRLEMIAWAEFHWQQSGLCWSHIVVGSIVSLVGIVVSLIVFWLIISRGRPLVPRG